MSRPRRAVTAALAVVVAAGAVAGCDGTPEVEQRKPVWTSAKLPEDSSVAARWQKLFYKAADETVFATDGTGLHAMPVSGDPDSWSFHEVGTGFAAYLFDDDTVVGFERAWNNSEFEGGELTVFDTRTGEKRFEYAFGPEEGDGARILSATAVADVAVVVTTEMETDPVAWDTRLRGISLTDGEELWNRRFDTEPYDVHLAAPIPVRDAFGTQPLESFRPLADSSVIYLDVASEDELVAVDVGSGEQRWRLGESVAELSQLPPVLMNDGLITFAHPDSGVLVADPATDEVATIETDALGEDETFGRPSDGDCLVGRGARNRPQVFDVTDRELVMTVDEWGDPLGCNDSALVYVTDGEGYDMEGDVVSIPKGKKLWSFSGSGDGYFKPTRLYDDVLLGHGIDKLLAKDLKTGEIRWQIADISVEAATDRYLVGVDDKTLRLYDSP